MNIVEGRDGSLSVTIESAPLAPMPLQAERDELLAALKRLSRTYMEHNGTVSTDAMNGARALIARIEGGK